MSVLLVIPARYASSRFPGKPLAELCGATGVRKTLIERSWEAASLVSGVDRTIIATDDERIASHCAAFGGDVVMTDAGCRNGTERCADALGRVGERYDVVVNLQGDAPLTPPHFVEALIPTIKAGAAVATPVLRCDADALGGFMDDRAAGRVGGTTAVFDRSGNALYFSKEVLPYTGRRFAHGDDIPVFHHVGVYAYAPLALSAYAGWDEGRLEAWEGLEQLRFMENGMSVSCVEVTAPDTAFWELNNPEDVPRIEAILAARGTP